MRIVTFNIKHGLSRRGHVDLPLLAGTCAGFRADLLALQEVDRRAWRSGWSDQVGLVARATGLSATFGEVVRRGVFRRYGNALLGRGGLSEVEVLGLPRPDGGEPRVAVLATFEADGARLSVAATHLSIRGKEAPVQLEVLLAALGRRPLPRVLLGDLNLGPEVVEPAVAAAGYELAPTPPTFPAARPRSRIDYVAVAGLRVVAADVPETMLSDHRPVVAEVRLPGGGHDSLPAGSSQ